MRRRAQGPRGSRKPTPDLRPITGRALQSIKDTLRPYFGGARVLDLYAGSGRFGATALDEGASEVVMVEKSPKTAAELRRAMEKRPGARVLCDDALHYLDRAASSRESFDVVMADPPFRLWDESFAESLVSRVARVLRPGAIFLVRYPKKMLVSLPVHGLGPCKTSVFGESELLYLAYGNGE